jgi:hypothetical protein
MTAHPVRYDINLQNPVADGGDGTVEAALDAGYERVPVRVSGPLGEPVDTAYALRDSTAVVEMADACGLVRMPPRRLVPLEASSAGLGEVVRAALDAGCRLLVIGVGGSASTDGGAGMLRALGARFLDADGVDLPPGGGPSPAWTGSTSAGCTPGWPGRRCSSLATWTTRCSDHKARPWSTARRRAPALRTSRFSTPPSPGCPRCSER